MDEELTTMEIKHTIRYFLSLSYQISVLEDDLVELKERAYSVYSFTGTSPYGHSFEEYQHAVSPEYFVINLVMEEEALKRRLKRKKAMLHSFKRYVPYIDRPTLKTLLKHPVLTELEKHIYMQIQRVYIKMSGYDKVNRLREFVGENAELVTHRLDNIEPIIATS